MITAAGIKTKKKSLIKPNNLHWMESNDSI